MQNTNNKMKKLSIGLLYLLFFLISFIYFSWIANYIFFYQEKSSLFLVSFAYLGEHLKQPGGFLDYLGKLFIALYYIENLGAFLLAFIMLLIVRISVLAGRTIAGSSSLFVSFLLGAGFVFLHTHYQFLPVNSLGILLQLGIFYAAIRLYKSKWKWLNVVFFPLWYFLTGGFAWLFLLMYAFYLISSKGKERWIHLGSIFFWASFAFYISNEYLFYATTKSLMQFPYSSFNTGMQTWEFFLLSALVVLLPLLYKMNGIYPFNRMNEIPILKQIPPLVVVLVLVVALVFRHDKKNSHYFYTEKLFYEEKYDELIAFNSTAPSTNKLTLFHNNIALAKTGQLTGRLFDFPQSPDGSTLFLKWENIGEVLRRGGQFYYSLGMVNEANRWAYEYMVMRGYTPEGLKMLIKTELINGNYKVAEKYIHILEQSFFYRKEANAFRLLLYNDVAVDAHPELGLAKQYRPINDFFVLSDEPAANIDYILASDSTNVFAIEYKFALLLLNKDIEGVVKNLPLLEKAEYARLPKHIDEAVSGYKMLRMGDFPDLEYLDSSKETEHRFNQYYQVFQQNNSSRLQAQRALHQNFADTFWYYLFFN